MLLQVISWFQVSEVEKTWLKYGRLETTLCHPVGVQTKDEEKQKDDFTNLDTLRYLVRVKYKWNVNPEN